MCVKSTYFVPLTYVIVTSFHSDVHVFKIVYTTTKMKAHIFVLQENVHFCDIFLKNSYHIAKNIAYRIPQIRIAPALLCTVLVVIFDYLGLKVGLKYHLWPLRMILEASGCCNGPLGVPKVLGNGSSKIMKIPENAGLPRGGVPGPGRPAGSFLTPVLLQSSVSQGGPYQNKKIRKKSKKNFFQFFC